MQHENSQIEILTGYEMNAYKRRLFSNINFFDSLSNNISWTFIYKYLDIYQEIICRPKNPTNENFKKPLIIYQTSAPSTCFHCTNVTLLVKQLSPVGGPTDLDGAI